jgi:predicted O-methyltransferase YrrM
VQQKGETKAMTPKDIAEATSGTGYMTLEKGQLMTELILQHKPKRVLELGFAHGVSTCYIAAALQRAGGGHLVSIDTTAAKNRRPHAEELLKRCSLESFVSLTHEERSYTWGLKRLLEKDSPEPFDLCFIDGAHTWDADGLAFFLVDMMLAEEGWIVFDDYDWCYATSPSLKNRATTLELPMEEQVSKQIAAVFELLVKRHPAYGKFRVDRGWAFTQKLNCNKRSLIRTEHRYHQSVIDRLLQKARKALGAENT